MITQYIKHYVLNDPKNSLLTALLTTLDLANFLAPEPEPEPDLFGTGTGTGTGSIWHRKGENLGFPTVKTARFYHVWLLRYSCLKGDHFGHTIQVTFDLQKCTKFTL